MAESEKPWDWGPSGGQIGGGLIDGAAEGMKDAGKTMLREAPKATRLVARRIPGLPGLVLNGAQYLTAKDRKRALAEIVGGAIGTGMGMAVGGPLGAAAGSIAGQKAGELIYDHRDDIKAAAKALHMKLADEAAIRLRPHVPPPLRYPGIAP